MKDNINITVYMKYFFIITCFSGSVSADNARTVSLQDYKCQNEISKLPSYYELYVAASRLMEAIEVCNEQSDYQQLLDKKYLQEIARANADSQAKKPSAIVSPRWRKYTSMIPVCDAIDDLSLAKESFSLKINEIDLEFKSKLLFESDKDLSTAACSGDVIGVQQEIEQFIDKATKAGEIYAKFCPK